MVMEIIDMRIPVNVEDDIVARKTSFSHLMWHRGPRSNLVSKFSHSILLRRSQRWRGKLPHLVVLGQLLRHFYL